MSVTTRPNSQTYVRQLGRIRMQIGNTPMLSIKRLNKNENVRIFAKAEWQQLSGSVKARAAFRIISDALISGELLNKTLIDATSGNTGIAYAYICAALNIPITLCLPENASKERKEILTSLGVKLILTSPFGGTDEAQEVAKEIATKKPDKFYYANQYRNPSNVLAHFETTGTEIISALPDITHFICALGTSGTFTGTSLRLKKFNPDIQIIALQPDSPLHGMEGWKHMETAIIPSIYQPKLADRFIEVKTDEAYAMIKEAKEKEGWLLSPSAAGNLVGALKVANEIPSGNLVCMFPDNYEKYSELYKSLKL